MKNTLRPGDRIRLKARTLSGWSGYETAARLIREGGRDDSAAWRLADAGLEFRRLIERKGEIDVIGVHHPTGMGATLPKERTP